MHEFALCQSILETAVNAHAQLEPPGGKLLEVRVVAGGMHAVVPDYLQNAWQALRRDTVAEEASLTLRMTPITAACGDCSWEGEVVAPNFICGDCGHYGVTITGGREFYVETLEVEDEHNT